MMTKKDYVAIGKVLKPYVSESQAEVHENLLHDIITDICEVFSEDNPLFDKQRFIQFVYKKEEIK